MKKLFCAIFIIILGLAVSACDGTDSVGGSASEKGGIENNKNEIRQDKISGKIAIFNNDSFTNAENRYTTDKHIYYIGNGVQRYDKVTGTSTSMTDKHARVVGVTKETIYYIETSSQYLMLYRVSDDLAEAEYLYKFSSGEKFLRWKIYILCNIRWFGCTKYK